MTVLKIFNSFETSSLEIDFEHLLPEGLKLEKYHTSDDVLTFEFKKEIKFDESEIISFGERVSRKLSVKSISKSDEFKICLFDDDIMTKSKIVNISFGSLNKERAKIATRAIFALLTSSVMMLATACGQMNDVGKSNKQQNEREYVSTERDTPELEKYIAEFVIEAESRGVDVRVNLSELKIVKFVEELQNEEYGLNVMGQCKSMIVTSKETGEIVERYRTVSILSPEIRFREYRNVPFVDQHDMENSLRETVFHELGHCLLNLEHSDKYKNPNNKRMDIMSKITAPVSTNVSDSDWNDAVDGLFELNRVKNSR